jgi:flagellar protein FlgJ
MANISTNLSPELKATAAATTGQSTDAAAKEKKLKKACADFESMLVYQLLKTMRQTIPKDGLLKSSQGRQTYEMMLDQKLATELTNKGEGLGLQTRIYKQLTGANLKKD